MRRSVPIAVLSLLFDPARAHQALLNNVLVKFWPLFQCMWSSEERGLKSSTVVSAYRNYGSRLLSGTTSAFTSTVESEQKSSEIVECVFGSLAQPRRRRLLGSLSPASVLARRFSRIGSIGW